MAHWGVASPGKVCVMVSAGVQSSKTILGKVLYVNDVLCVSPKIESFDLREALIGVAAIDGHGEAEKSGGRCHARGMRPNHDDVQRRNGPGGDFPRCPVAGEFQRPRSMGAAYECDADDAGDVEIIAPAAPWCAASRAEDRRLRQGNPCRVQEMFDAEKDFGGLGRLRF